MQNVRPILAWKIEVRRNNIARSFIKEPEVGHSFQLIPPDWRSRVARDEIKIFRASVPCARGRKRGAGAGAGEIIRVTKHEKSWYFTIYLVQEKGVEEKGVEMAHPDGTLSRIRFVSCANFTRAQQFSAAILLSKGRGKEKWIYGEK